MRYIILSSVAWTALPYSSILSNKHQNFRKKCIEHKMCVLIFSTTFVWNIYHSKNKWVRYDKKCILVFMWSTRYSCPILMKLELSTDFPKILKYQISWKSVQRESSCSMRTWPTDMKLIADFFAIFANAPKNITRSDESRITSMCDCLPNIADGWRST